MKKLVIAGASVALAAMPVLGVFAVDMTDNVEIDVTETCTISAVQSQNSVDLGEKTTGQTSAEVTGGIMTVNCNDTVNGWNLKATANNLTATGTGTAITFGTANAKGSSYTAKMTPGGDGLSDGATNAWSSYATAAANDAVIVHDTKSVSNLTLQPTYKATIGATQEVDTYTGSVTYTFVTLPVSGS